MGRHGEGPGELKYPSYKWTSDEGVHVFDMANHRETDSTVWASSSRRTGCRRGSRPRMAGCDSSLVACGSRPPKRRGEIMRLLRYLVLPVLLLVAPITAEAQQVFTIDDAQARTADRAGR